MKAPTARGVSMLLGKSGLSRSVRVPSRIRGFRDMSRGYEVTSLRPGEVRVTWHPGIGRTNDADLARIIAAAEAAGFKAEPEAFGTVVVTARLDPEDA